MFLHGLYLFHIWDLPLNLSLPQPLRVFKNKTKKVFSNKNLRHVTNTVKSHSVCLALRLPRNSTLGYLLFSKVSSMRLLYATTKLSLNKCSTVNLLFSTVCETPFSLEEFHHAFYVALCLTIL